MVEVVSAKFKISSSFDDWVKRFDSDLDAQKAAGVTPLFRSQSKHDPRTVLVALKGNQGVAEKFLQENTTRIKARYSSFYGHVVGTEEVITSLA